MSSYRTSAQALDALRQLVASTPDGLRLEEIAVAMPGMARRTLQRRLAALVQDGRIQRQGRGPATRYFPVPQALRDVVSDRAAIDDAFIRSRIPLSEDALEVRRYVSLPLQQRHPAGYQRSFLTDYRPNVDAWLPEPVRAHLRQIGALPDAALAAGTYSRHLLDRLLIDLSWNSSRLEGNTYSLLETYRLLEAGAAADGRSALETQMLLNHKQAIEFLVSPDSRMDRHTILSLHALLSDNLLPDPAAGGRLRARPVGIAQSVYEPPVLPQLVEECFGLLLAKASAITDPYEQGFFLMVQLPYLQPFEDVNKRVSRLAANIPLLRQQLCPVSFIDVPQDEYIKGLLAIYERNRIELLRDVFVWACERSAARYAAVQQSLGEPDPFRLRYRATIGQLVSQIVRQRIPPQKTPAYIRAHSQSIPSVDRSRFQETVESELLGLHEGNIARYHLRPSEFNAWHKMSQGLP